MNSSYNDAIPLSELLRQWGFNPNIFNTHEARKENKLEEVIPILKKLIKLENNFFGYKMLGAIYIKNNLIKKGLIYLEHAYQLKENDPQNLYNLSGVYLLVNQPDKAKIIAEKLGQIDPNFPGFQKLWKQIEKLNN